MLVNESYLYDPYFISGYDAHRFSNKVDVIFWTMRDDIEEARQEIMASALRRKGHWYVVCYRWGDRDNAQPVYGGFVTVTEAEKALKDVRNLMRQGHISSLYDAEIASIPTYSKDGIWNQHIEKYLKENG